MEFKSEFISYLLSMVLEFIAIVLFWFSLKNSGVTFEGWQSEDIIALNAFFLVSQAVGIFSFGFRDIEYKINDGSFDNYLARPHSPFFLLALERLNLIYFLFNFVVGISLITFLYLTYSIQLISVFKALFVSVIGTVSLELIYMSFSLLSFRFGRIYYARELFFSFSKAARYPLDIFPTSLLRVFTFLLPIVFLASFPARILMGRMSDSTQVILLSVLILSIQLLIYRLLKERALRIYSSTGN
ncbi:MAG: ABC-2 family transporter protein [Eubacteriales bacterium]|nr:ABC-2 family transporter protein [Eubacteriales bacterium]